MYVCPWVCKGLGLCHLHACVPVSAVRVRLSFSLCVCVSAPTTPCRRKPACRQPGGPGSGSHSGARLPFHLPLHPASPSPPSRWFLGHVELCCAAPAPPDQLPYLKATTGGLGCPRPARGNPGTERGPECPAPKTAPPTLPGPAWGSSHPAEKDFLGKYAETFPTQPLPLSSSF